MTSPFEIIDISSGSYRPRTETIFVGRAKELDALQSWLLEDTRIINVVGAAGIGKTRFLEKFAQSIGDHFGRYAIFLRTNGVIREEDTRPLLHHIEKIPLWRRKELIIIVDNASGKSHFQWAEGIRNSKIILSSREKLTEPSIHLPPLSITESTEILNFLLRFRKLDASTMLKAAHFCEGNPRCLHERASDLRFDQLSQSSLRGKIPSQTNAPLAIVTNNGRFEVSEDIRTGRANASLVEMHEELVDAAQQADQHIGANHNQIHNLLRRYLGALGKDIPTLAPIRLGCLGIKLQEHAGSYFEEGRDPLYPEQRGALNALLALHGVFIRLVPEWREFVAEAELTSLSDQAVQALTAAVQPIIKEIANEKDSFDKEIPDRLALISSGIGPTSDKISKFALARSFQNVLACMGHYALGAFRMGADKSRDQITDGIAKSLKLIVVAIILKAATELSGLAAQAPQMFHWVKPLIEVFRQN